MKIVFKLFKIIVSIFIFSKKKLINQKMNKKNIIKMQFGLIFI